MSVKSPLHAKGTGGLIMFGTMEPWGYGSFSPLPLWPGSSGASGSYDRVLRDRAL